MRNKPVVEKAEGRRSQAGFLLFWLYSLSGERIRSVIRKLVEKLEGGELYSLTLRKIFAHYHGIEVGLYTSGAPFRVNAFRAGTTIGRYCSIFNTVRAFNANHPMNLRSTHAFFYNPALGIVQEDLLQRPSLAVGHDVLIGHGAIVLSGVRTIGDGAVIGAGSVVFENVPPYAVVVGHPARIVRYRFKKEVVAEVMLSRWWDSSIDALRSSIDEFRRPLDGDAVR